MVRRWRGVLAAIIILGVGVGFVIWRLMDVAPSWYAPPNAADQSVIDLADRVEYRLVQETQRIRPAQDDRWSLRITDAQINAWLSARLSKWIMHQTGSPWPAEVGTPQVNFSPRGISITLPLMHELKTRYVTVRVKPTIQSGTLRLELQRVAIGRVGLPGEAVANLLQTIAESAPGAMDHPQIKTTLDWLDRREHIDPVLELEDGRRIRLLNIRLDHGSVDVTAQTLPRDQN